jgi:hypothetical protein
MSTLGKAVLQAVALWFHLGIEPLIGGGPMQSCHKTQSRRLRAVSLNDGETLTASPRKKRHAWRARRATVRVQMPACFRNPLSAAPLEEGGMSSVECRFRAASRMDDQRAVEP